MAVLSRHSTAETDVLNTLRKQKERLEAQRDQLNCEILKLQEKYGEVYNRGATVIYLPVETLCTIFELAQGYTPFGGSRAPLMEVIISHVCRRWRDVALSFPKLWTSFIHCGIKKDMQQRLPQQRLRAYLERSKMQPIDIWLDFSSLLQHRTPELVQLLARMLPHISRWRRIAFVSDKDNPLLGFHTYLTSSAAPQLEYFLMSPGIPLESGESEEEELRIMQGIRPLIFAGGAPKLQYVRIDSHSPPRFLPPLFNITILRLEEGYDQTNPWISWTTFLEILCLPSLRALSIYGRHFLAPESDMFSPFKMDNLQHLRVGYDENVAQFIPYIVAPVTRNRDDTRLGPSRTARL